MNTRIMPILTAGILLALLCTAGCAPAAGTDQPEATQAPASEKVVEETSILRVSIAQAPMPANLIDLQKNLLNDLFRESSIKLTDAGFPVQIEQGIPRTMAGLYGCQTLFLPPVGEFDLYLMDSSLTLHAQKEQGFYPVPGDVLEKYGRPAWAIERGFTDASGQAFGLPAATTPVMLIYNPEMLGVLPEPVTIEMIVDYADTYPIWVPEHGGIGVALTHSLFGNDFTPDLFYDKGMYDRFGEYEELYERYRSMGAGKSASTEEIVNGFYNQEIAWTVHSSGFLALLAQRDYQGAVAVAPFPVVKKVGLLQPIIVRGMGEGYQIIAGERRWRACRMAGLERVPVRVLNTNELESLEIALIENLQREDLNAIEEARGYRKLLSEFQMTQAELADKVSKSRSTITNALRLLDLPEEVQDLVYAGSLSAGHARAVLSVPEETARVKLATKIVQDGLSVREAENLARLYAAGQLERAPRPVAPKSFKAVARKLRRLLGTNVRVRQGKDKSKIEIEFHSEEELERIFALLTEGAAASEEVIS